MIRKTIFSLFLLIGIAMLFPAPAFADGIIVPDPPPNPLPGPIPISQLVIRYHHVDVTIKDQIAITHVDQVFYNPNDWTVEGTYLFPIPLGGTVNDFVLWIDGEPVRGEILDANQARETYEQIVRNMQDPALLEYADRMAVKARIFPIPPGEERRIELEYTEVLKAENGLVRYLYPLNTEKFSLSPLDDVRITVNISSSAPIRAAYSPSHQVAIDRDDNHHIRAGYEQTNILPDRDFVLLYSVGEGNGLHILTYRDSNVLNDEDGFFMLFLAPRSDMETVQVSKDVILVLDRSGSMEGEKFQQAQEALKFILSHLNADDRFNVIAFSTGLDVYSSNLRPSKEASEAIRWVERQSAVGSTDINRALLEAASIADSERSTYLIFLTDGLPTEGVIESKDIIENFAVAARKNIKLFAFGVGYDVDTYLLDTLAQEHQGTSTYVLPGDQLNEVLSSFYEKISSPVLTDLNLDIEGLTTYDIYPDPLPDLFMGSQIIVVGRYRDGGRKTIKLSGYINGERQTYSYPNQIFSQDYTHEMDMIPRIWATRKIGYLLNQIRLNGPEQELVDQIVRLSIRYGIVTPYTSYLVTESQPLGDAAQDRIVEEEMAAMNAAPTMPSFGREAVEKAAEQGAMKDAESITSPSVEVANRIRNIGARTFVYSNGVWMDTAFDPDKMTTVKVAFLSDDYFRLSRKYPVLSTAFSLGDGVIAVWDGVAYEIVPSDQVVPSIDIPSVDQPTVPAEKENTIDIASIVPSQEKIEGRDNTAKSIFPCLGGLIPFLFVPLLFIVWVKTK
ncbi:MAG TPA: VWA domain-containing protein [Anaerolineae bacterium]|nr:VWA domain-containing protein [Anaerolineae bacterium]